MGVCVVVWWRASLQWHSCVAQRQNEKVPAHTSAAAAAAVLGHKQIH